MRTRFPAQGARKVPRLLRRHLQKGRCWQRRYSRWKWVQKPHVCHRLQFRCPQHWLPSHPHRKILKHYWSILKPKNNIQWVRLTTFFRISYSALLAKLAAPNAKSDIPGRRWPRGWSSVWVCRLCASSDLRAPFSEQSLNAHDNTSEQCQWTKHSSYV